MNKIQTLAPITEMLSMQSALNEMTNGPDWRSGKTNLGKSINWKRCIVMETAELIDSYPWKHWKSVEAEVDMENARVELVDIWHFILSLALENMDTNALPDLINKTLQSAQKITHSSNHTVIEQVRIHEVLMRTALETTQVTESYMGALLSAFWNSCKLVELNFEALYQIYMAKNVLNTFRQNNGYKEGRYIKIWNGKEDNVVMFEIIENMTNFSGEELYVSLTNYYSQLSE